MTTRPPWPPEIVEAYDRGERVEWSPLRARWISLGLPKTTHAPKELNVTRRRVEDPAPATVAEPPPAPRPLSPCPRCGGRMVHALEADGTRDDHCLACGRRAEALTPEQQAALVAERNGYDSTGTRVRARYREPQMRRGAL